MDAERATGAAFRRRQRRLRSWLRHERQSVAMELAAALHHSRDARSEVVHVALRGQKTASSGTRPEPPVEVSEPRVVAVTVGYVAAPVPLLSAPMLADAVADAVDTRTAKYLLRAALKKLDEEERKKATAQVKAMTELVRRVPRKRKKRRKRRLPRDARIRRCGQGFRSRFSFSGAQCSLPSSTGLRCSASWPVCTRRTFLRSSSFMAVAYAMLVWLVPSVARPRMPCIMAVMDQKDSSIRAIVVIPGSCM